MLTEIAREVHAENAPHLPTGERVDFDDVAFKARVTAGLADSSIVAGILYGESGPEGAALLEVLKFWYSANGWFLTEHFVYVRPPHRKGRNAIMLLEFAKRSAKTLGLPLYVGVMTTSRGDAKSRLYKRAFGAPYGAYFAYNVGG